ncbi:MAG TPA: hypothetical protein ENH85_00495 [Candidatus Scalindua sp.]|nr:hypothetical protein [Candidatus Scalindua sp.]
MKLPYGRKQCPCGAILAEDCELCPLCKGTGEQEKLSNPYEEIRRQKRKNSKPRKDKGQGRNFDPEYEKKFPMKDDLKRYLPNEQQDLAERIEHRKKLKEQLKNYE